ncbi:MAG: endo alpha-1,4 polygalactosaminidase [Cellulophaga sp.]
MRLINIIYFLVPFLGSSQNTEAINLNKDLFICYGKISPEMIKGYGLVIIETQHYSALEIEIFKSNNETVLGYLSITEVHKSSFFYNEIKEYTIGENKNWGSSYLDISNVTCREVLFKVISKMIEKGVDGLFLDNLDNVSQWGNLKEKKEPLISFIKEIKDRNPSLYLMQNSGLFLNNELKKSTNSILVESLLTAYNFETRSYTFRDAALKKKLLKNLKKITNKSVYLVEYADELEMKNKIEEELKSIGFPYFIGNINLQTNPNFSTKNKN